MAGRPAHRRLADPSPLLPLLEQLKDDPSEYVRRSVANNLNDIAKDHPAVVLGLAKDWRRGASPQRKRLVEHGLRTLLKRGDLRALELIGAGGGAALRTSGRVGPRRVKLGDRITFVAAVRNEGKVGCTRCWEARVHFVRVKGTSIKPGPGGS